jgi:adenylosuccinate synthase
MGATIIVDAFWGDAGKGKFSAYLSSRLNADICVRAGIGPNAGHSIYLDDKMIRTRLVPLGFMNPKTKLMIGSGVAIDPRLLQREIAETHTEGRMFVDGRCPVIQKKHVAIERRDATMIRIDSTKSGAGAARAEYVMRRAKRACDLQSLRPYVTDVALECNASAKERTVVVEGSQATYLSLYLSYRYPYTSSDNCTAAAFIDDVGLNWRLVRSVLLLVKCLPTAVGNGPLPHEMSSKEIRSRGLEEFGVNTGRPRRRTRKIDLKLLRYSAMLNGPTEIALTYCDQYDARMAGCRTRKGVTPRMIRLINLVEKHSGAPVRYLDTGKEFSNIIEL